MKYRTSIVLPFLAAGFVAGWCLESWISQQAGGAAQMQSRQVAAGLKNRDGGRGGSLTALLPRGFSGIDEALESPIRDEQQLLALVKTLALSNPAEALRLVISLEPASDRLRDALVAALVSSVSVETAAQLCRAMPGMRGPGIKGVLRSLAKLWGRSDFGEAFAWADKLGDPALRGSALQAVLEGSPKHGSDEWNVALSSLPSHLQDGAVKSLVEALPVEETLQWLQANCTEHDKWESWAISALQRKGNPSAALESAARLGWLDANIELSKTMRGWQSWEDPQAFRAALQNETDQEKARLMVESGIQGLMNSDPASGLSLLRSRADLFDHESLRRLSEKVTDLKTFSETLRSAEGLDPSLRFTGMCALCDMTARSDPSAAKGVIEELAASGYTPSREDMTDYRIAMDSTLRHWVQSRAPGEEIVSWAKSLPPGPAQDLGLEYSTRKLVSYDNAAALSAASAIADPGQRIANLALVAATTSEWRTLVPGFQISPTEVDRIEAMAAGMRPHLERLTR